MQDKNRRIEEQLYIILEDILDIIIILENVEILLEILEIKLCFFEPALTLDQISQFKKCLEY